MGRRVGVWGLRRWSPGPLLFAVLGAVALLVVFFSHALRGPEPKPPAESAPVVVAPPADPLGELAAILEKRATWEVRAERIGSEWLGRIPQGMSLVRWNAETTAALESAGLQVLAGREDLIDRRGRVPLQRLTLEIGVMGEFLTTVVVETARQSSLPTAF